MTRTVTDATKPVTRVDSSYRPRGPLDLRQTLGHLLSGTGDPRMCIDGGTFWFALRTPYGVATLALREHGDEIRTAAWSHESDATAWALDLAPELLGASDDSRGFDASLHPLIEHVHHRNPGLKLSRTTLVFEALASAIMEQKITTGQAYQGWRYVLRHFGERAPGPTPKPMYAAPTTDEWWRIPSWHWHKAGVEPPQSKTIVRAAMRGERLAEATLAAETGEARDSILTSIVGIGPWTAAMTRDRALGDPDAVAIGDFHLAHQVGYALTGSRTDDDGMLELLEPWRGQRLRVIRLILRSGRIEPRRGARMHPEDHRER